MGPSESRLIRHAMNEKQRCGQGEPNQREDDVDRSLRCASQPRKSDWRNADEGHPFDRVDCDLRADDLEEARHDVDLDLEPFELPNQRDLLHVAFIREGEDDPLDIEYANEVGQLLGGPEQDQMAEILASLLRLVVDEPDEVEPVFLVMEDLPRDQLTDIAGADDDGVLQVERAPSTQRAGDDPR